MSSADPFGMPSESNSNDGRGVLFPQKKKTEKGPDVSGNIEVGPGLLREMVDRYKGSKGPVKLRLVGWRKTPKDGGNQYMSLAVSLERESKEAAADDELTL
jgi:hypothetical protein